MRLSGRHSVVPFGSIPARNRRGYLDILIDRASPPSDLRDSMENTTVWTKITHRQYAGAQRRHSGSRRGSRSPENHPPQVAMVAACLRRWWLCRLGRGERLRGSVASMVGRTDLRLARQMPQIGKDVERSIPSAEAWIMIAHIRLITRRLARCGYR